MPCLKVSPSVSIEVQLREVARTKGVRHDLQGSEVDFPIQSAGVRGAM